MRLAKIGSQYINPAHVAKVRHDEYGEVEIVFAMCDSDGDPLVQSARQPIEEVVYEINSAMMWTEEDEEAAALLDSSRVRLEVVPE